MTEPNDSRNRAERKPIFSAKGERFKIGYIADKMAFDLLGRLRCNYDGTSGNLSDPESGKIVGHVSLEGKFVGASWLAEELFGSRSDNGITRPGDALMKCVRSLSEDEPG
jgi:hypothetical protein